MRRSHIAIVAAILGAAIAASAAWAIDREQKITPPGNPGSGIEVAKSVASNTEDQISKFSILRQPSSEFLDSMSDEDRTWLNYGLTMVPNTSRSAGVSSIGKTEFDSGSHALVFTIDDQICLIAIRSDRGTNGTCSNLDSAASGGVFSAGVFEQGPDFFVVGILPDTVKEISTVESGSEGKLQFHDNVYLGVVEPKNFQLLGTSDGGQVVTKTEFPIAIYAKG